MDTRTDNRAPARSDAQRRDALKKANRIRAARATLKRRIKYDPSYRLLEAAIHADTEALGLEADELATMKVYELLVTAPKFGRVKANTALTRTRTSPSKTVGGLSERQREELVAALELERRRVAGRNRNYNRMLEEAYS